MAIIDGLRHLRSFITVARVSSFTRAARELNISQPALSVQIRQLENELGIALLDRNKRKVTLTEAGRELLGPLERIFMDVESIMSTGRDFAKLRRGIVTVAAVPTLAATLIPRALGDFSRAYPGISVRLRDSLGASLAELVKDGDVDFAVGGEMPENPDVVTEHLFSERVCLFAPIKHALARKQIVTLRELATYPVILPEKHTSVRVLIERAFDQQKLSLRPLHETGHISTTMRMVNAGIGIAILPARAMECFLSTNIRCISITRPIIERHVVIAAKAGRSRSPAVQKFIEILHKITLPESA
jgi:LysR family transcriptional regulator, carnitine catabolism transcriptional activator